MKYPRYKIVLAIIDYVLILMAFSIALELRGILFIHQESWWSDIQSTKFLFFFFYSFFIIIIFQTKRLYKIDIILNPTQQIVSVFNSFFFAIIGLAVLNYFVHTTWIMDSRLAVLYFAILGFFSIASFRILFYRPLFMYLGKKQILQKNILIVGTNLEAKNFAVQFSVNNIYGVKLIGFVDNTMPVKFRVFEQYEILGRFKDIPALVEKYQIQEIIVSVSNVSHSQLLHIVDICKKSSAAVRVTSTLFDIIHKKISPDVYFNIPLARLSNSEVSPGRLLGKRIFDVVFSTFVLICISPFFLLIALIIKLTSKGPIFYHQVRIGKDGKEFNIYKFRSMVLDSDEDDERVQKAKEFIQNGKSDVIGFTKIVNVERITPIGRFLRKTSVDEMPQLFNVLKGDMSLVGPRPCLSYEYEFYDEWHKRRVSVLPGCTGLWQVSGRSEVGFDDMVVLDLYYIDNISPWFDLHLILKTIPVIVFGKGAK
jgi:exopolysaccharide biosynthesis polyprenyl glycosylphosphotransferase